MTVASLGPRVKGLKDKLNTAYEAIGARTDALVTRLEKADGMHNNAVNAHNAQLSEIEAGITQIENLARQMTNGPLDVSQTTHPDSNGVTVNSTK